MPKKYKRKRVYQQKMWDAALFYRKEAEKCYKARAYFSALVARSCELEALLRIFDFVENNRPKDRSQKRRARKSLQKGFWLQHKQ